MHVQIYVTFTFNFLFFKMYIFIYFYCMNVLMFGYLFAMCVCGFCRSQNGVLIQKMQGHLLLVCRAWGIPAKLFNRILIALYWRARVSKKSSQGPELSKDKNQILVKGHSKSLRNRLSSSVVAFVWYPLGFIWWVFKIL